MKIALFMIMCSGVAGQCLEPHRLNTYDNLNVPHYIEPDPAQREVHDYLFEIKNKSDVILKKNIKIGGMVKNGSIQTNKNEIKFIVTDFKNEIIVSYKGSVPALFAEGKGVVAEGKLRDKKFFLAKRI